MAEQDAAPARTATTTGDTARPPSWMRPLPPAEIAKIISESPQTRVLNKSAPVAEVVAAAEKLLGGA